MRNCTCRLIVSGLNDLNSVTRVIKKIVQNVYGEFPTITHTFVTKSSSYVCRRLSDRVDTIAYFVYILFRQNVRAVNSTRGFALLCTSQWLT